MTINNIIKKLPWKKSNGTMNKARMDTVVIHHDAQFIPSRGYNTLERIKMHAKLHITKGYGHLSYHFVIDNTGEVFQCLPETEVGYHCGNYPINCKSLAICLHGNFEVQIPTTRQLLALRELFIYLATQRPDLPKIIKSSFKAHRDIKATSCPGTNLHKQLKNILK